MNKLLLLDKAKDARVVYAKAIFTADADKKAAFEAAADAYNKAIDAARAEYHESKEEG